MNSKVWASLLACFLPVLRRMTHSLQSIMYYFHKPSKQNRIDENGIILPNSIPLPKRGLHLSLFLPWDLQGFSLGRKILHCHLIYITPDHVTYYGQCDARKGNLGNAWAAVSRTTAELCHGSYPHDKTNTGLFLWSDSANERDKWRRATSLPEPMWTRWEINGYLCKLLRFFIRVQYKERFLIQGDKRFFLISFPKKKIMVCIAT